MKKLTLLFAVILGATSFVCAQDTPLLMRTPTMNKTHIVFSYAGDLWSVGRDGGEAVELTCFAREIGVVRRRERSGVEVRRGSIDRDESFRIPEGKRLQERSADGA